MDKKAKLVKLKIQLGVFLIFLWWLPFWLIAGLIDTSEDIHSAARRRHILVMIIIVQSIFGIIGAILLGKTLMENMKHTKFRKFPKVAWDLFKTGKYEKS
jgi:hypothetical protein